MKQSRPLRTSSVVVLAGLLALPGWIFAAPRAVAAPEFSDVVPGAAFYDDIIWLSDQEITRGAVGPDGSVIFGPADSITREAMAAFIYRFLDEPPFEPPTVSPFSDLEPGAAFYPEITWLEAEGIAPGKDAGGEALFRPTEMVTREVMAWWLYRALAGPGFVPPAVSPFVDVPTDHPSYLEISWMHESGISTGAPLGDGAFRYAPEDEIRREAMAAFLHRAEGLALRGRSRPPIVVLGDEGNRFAEYYAEILLTEGLNEFAVLDIAELTPETVRGADVAILAELSRDLTEEEVGVLTDWVTAGGNLVAMRPGPSLADLLGLEVVGGGLPDAGSLYSYLAIDPTAPAGGGLVQQPIQFHGPADLYAPKGATVVAQLYSDAASATGHPAVSLNSVGTSGGEAVAFAYDLARSVVETRQGNPRWAGQDRHSADPGGSRVMAQDMFAGGALWDARPDFVDFDLISLPQADEQMRLLANLIQYVNRDVKPLPRFWYFPRGERAVVIMTGDDHGSGNTAGRFDRYMQLSPPGCSVEAWECVRATAFMFGNATVTDAMAAQYEAKGFELGLHVDTGCVGWTPDALEGFYEAQLAAWAAAYPSLPRQSSVRTHCVTWSDWASQAKVEASHGIRLDANYYYYPPAWVAERPGLFTGSGMIMRFADLDGTVIDVYQATTQMTDESSLQGYGVFNPLHVVTLLDNAVGPQGFYGAFTANMHGDSVEHLGAEAIVEAAQARGVPVISAEQMVTWLDGRNGSSFDDVGWAEGVLSFDVRMGEGAAGLQALVPTSSAAGSLVDISHAGVSVSHTQDVIKGVEYAVFDALPGEYQVTYGPR